MSGRGWLYAALVAIAVGGPYLSSREERGGSSWWNSMWSSEDGAAPPLAAIGSGVQNVPTSIWGKGEPWSAAPAVSANRQGVATMPAVRPTEPPLPTLAESLRFDLAPSWVTQRWPYVWKRHGEGGLSSQRVTMVSGTRLTDLAGSLTYSFDKSHQLQRIELDGTCGDPSELIALVTSYYGLRPMTTVGGFQFVARGARNVITSALLVENSAVVRQSAPYERFRVSLELNHPGSGRQISDRMREKLDLPASDATGSDKKNSQNDKSGTTPSKSKLDDAYQRDPRRPLDALLPHAG